MSIDKKEKNWQKNIITTCSTHLRALKHLRIFFSNIPAFHDHYRRRRVPEQIEEMISRTICELEIPDPAVYSFQIRKGWSVYEVQKGDDKVTKQFIGTVQGDWIQNRCPIDQSPSLMLTYNLAIWCFVLRGFCWMVRYH